MKIAIMQPYFYPYVGYFELMKVVDKFIFLNDVQYVRRSWINRNKIRSKDKAHQWIALPVSYAPRETKIQDIKISNQHWTSHSGLILKSTYGKKIEENDCFVNFLSLCVFENLQDVLINSIKHTAKYLGITCDFDVSSGISNEVREKKIIDICNFFDADTYFNLSGGKNLYNQKQFKEIKINFLELTSYKNNFSISQK
jgi:hypothetical protein